MSNLTWFETMRQATNGRKAAQRAADLRKAWNGQGRKRHAVKVQRAARSLIPLNVPCPVRAIGSLTFERDALIN